MRPELIANRLQPTADVPTSARNWSDAVLDYAEALTATLFVNGVPTPPAPVPAVPGAFRPAREAFFTAMLGVLGTPGTAEVFCQKFEAAYNTFLLAGAPLAWPGFNAGFAPVPATLTMRLLPAFAKNMTATDIQEANMNTARAIDGYTKKIVWNPVGAPPVVNSMVLVA